MNSAGQAYDYVMPAGRDVAFSGMSEQDYRKIANVAMKRAGTLLKQIVGPSRHFRCSTGGDSALAQVFGGHFSLKSHGQGFIRLSTQNGDYGLPTTNRAIFFRLKSK